MSNIHEECGVFGIYSKDRADLASDCYYALFALQHRGQESAGITVNEKGRLRTHKDAGLVQDVFSSEVMDYLGRGNMAVGHVPTAPRASTRCRTPSPLWSTT